jgi:hypothetical protein
MPYLRCVPVGFRPALDEYAPKNGGTKQKCVKCHAEVWVHPFMANKGLKPVCAPCVDGSDEDYAVVITEEAINIGVQVAQELEELENNKGVE